MDSQATIGEIFNILRREKGLKQSDVADAIGSSTSFYSAIEVGRKSAPPEVLHQLIMFLKPNEATRRKINHLAAVQQKEVRINTSRLSPERTETAMLLARRLPDLNQADLKLLKAVLERKD